MVLVKPEEWDADRKRAEDEIPVHMQFLPEAGQLRLPVRNGFRARAVPDALRVLANEIEAAINARGLNAGNVAYEIYCAIRSAQHRIDGRVKKRKG